MVVFIDKQLGGHRHGRNYADPSPDRIRELASKIQSNWTPEERKRRASIAKYFQLKHIPLWPQRDSLACEAAE